MQILLIIFQIFRYRLVRHTWNLNVNESLNVDTTCTLNNASSDELGIDFYVKNQNQVHHALVTEIILSDITLFCPAYKLIPDSIKCNSNFMQFSFSFDSEQKMNLFEKKKKNIYSRSSKSWL